MKWNDLTMKERSDLISLFLKHGIGSLSDMRHIYDGEHNTEQKKDREYYLKLYQSGKISLDRIPKEFVPWIQGETSSVKRAVVQGRASGPLFDKGKVVDRVPGDEFNMANTGERLKEGTKGPIHAVFNYLFNKPGYVEERIRGSEGTGAELDLKTHEDAKRIYYGYSPKYGMLEKSPYRPTIGKAEENTYQINPLLSDAEFEGLIFPAWAAWKTGDKSFTTIGDWDPYLEDNPTIQRIVDEDKNDSKATLKDIPYLHDATISEGFDNKGQYISLYDKWDYSWNPTGGGKDAIGAITGGKPFDIYQRYYLDEWNDIPEESRGNPWIAPSIITDYSYMNGGKLKKKSKRFA